MQKVASRNRKSSLRHASNSASPLAKYDIRTILAPMRRTEAVDATNLAIEVVARDGITRDRVRIYGPTLRIEKPRRLGGAPRRMVYVRVRDRDRGVVHDVLIEAGKLIEHVVGKDANPPFSDEERNDAFHLIANHPSLSKLVRRKNVGLLWFQPQQFAGRRVIGARLVRLKNQYVLHQIAEAKVELDKCLVLEEDGHE